MEVKAALRRTPAAVDCLSRDNFHCINKISTLFLKWKLGGGEKLSLGFFLLVVARILFRTPRPNICPPLFLKAPFKTIRSAVQGCPLLAVYLPVVLHVGVVLVEP